MAGGQRCPCRLRRPSIHNDYKLNNMLLDAADPRRVTAVLDWEMTTVGDPLSDLASLLVYWTQPDEAELMGGLKSVTVRARLPIARRDRRAVRALERSRRSGLNWYLAFAYFKLGVICQQIYYRWFKGQTHDERFAGLGDVAIGLIRKAESLAGES